MASSPAKVLWKRLPTYFPNIKMIMFPLKENQREQLLKQGYLAQAAFKTTPNVNKLEIKEFLEKVYRVPVLSVNTAVYEGKKRRVGRVILQKPAYKKVWVKMHPGGLLTPGELTHEKAWRAEMETVKANIDNKDVSVLPEGSPKHRNISKWSSEVNPDQQDPVPRTRAPRETS